MGQEFTIKSPDIESKINQLLPSQGGFQPGVDFSASTMVVPIVDLTETAEGSSLRQDLQRAFSHSASNFFNINNTTTNMSNTPGYYEVFGFTSSSTSGGVLTIQITDGFSVKKIMEYVCSTSNQIITIPTVIVKLEAGDTLQGVSSAGTVGLRLQMRQIADVNGNLVNP
tara:strand:+ start:330 stop:836 length:507 start_codon:yes stop_codon:yes gene_type:complete